MDDYKELVEDLRSLVGNGEISYLSLGVTFCERAAEAIEQLVKERDELYMEVMDCTKKIGCKAIEQVKKERDAAIAELKMLEKHIGKSIPKRCKTCELWGKRGWSQFEVGYCEGDDNPHSPNDFCSRWRGVQE